MKIFNGKKMYVMLFMIVFGMAIFAGCSSSDVTNQEPSGSNDSAPDGDAGFKEYPIGDEKEAEGMKIGALYLQPVEMEPSARAGLRPDESDMHLEADIAALGGNTYGFGLGEFIPYLTVHYKVKNVDSGEEISGTFMPMNAGDGAHYGANVKLSGAGTYELTYMIESPEKMDYLLHTDSVTGVEADRFWTKPIELTWDFNWVPRKW